MLSLSPGADIKRMIHYKPDGKDFLLVNGNKRFNRALYGGNTAFRVDAGAATVLDLPLNSSKELKSLRLKAIPNDVVIGLMSVTLVR